MADKPEGPAPWYRRLLRPFRRRNRMRMAAAWRDFWHRDLWAIPSNDSPGGSWKTFFRIISLTVDGTRQNRIFNRAAALSYSSLLALGPLIVISVLMSSSIYDEQDTEVMIKNSLLFVAPSLEEYIRTERLENASLQAADPETVDPEATDEEKARAAAEAAEFADAVDELIRQVVSGANGLIAQVNTQGSKTLGFLGLALLIFLGIQLLTSIETTFNQIWGVSKGRPWGYRIIIYWSFITLGTIAGAASAAAFSASTLARLFSWVPFDDQLAPFFWLFPPILSFLAASVLLTIFYLFFPNTHIRLRPAMTGALVVATFLFVNNYLSLLYVQRVILLKSLYGSLGIVPVLMFGLYLFWVFVLLGSQISYATQNVNFLTHQAVWQRVSHQTRESISLAAFQLLARGFAQCRPPVSLDELGEKLRVPANLLNESLQQLTEMGWVTQVPREIENTIVPCFVPSRPLDRFTLADFRRDLEKQGNNAGIDHLVGIDPILDAYRQGIDEAIGKDLGSKAFDRLVSEKPALDRP